MHLLGVFQFCMSCTESQGAELNALCTHSNSIICELPPQGGLLPSQRFNIVYNSYSVTSQPLHGVSAKLTKSTEKMAFSRLLYVNHKWRIREPAASRKLTTAEGSTWKRRRERSVMELNLATNLQLDIYKRRQWDPGTLPSP